MQETKPSYKIIQDGDLVKKHNTKSEYLNDMTGFKINKYKKFLLGG